MSKRAGEGGSPVAEVFRTAYLRNRLNSSRAGRLAPLSLKAGPLIGQSEWYRGNPVSNLY